MLHFRRDVLGQMHDINCSVVVVLLLLLFIFVNGAKHPKYRTRVTEDSV